MRLTVVGHCLLIWSVTLSSTPARAQAVAPPPRLSSLDLKKLSLEQLTEIEVTSVSRREETLGDAPAALAVVTNEDIRRAGATTIPEALRLIPGIHAARATTSAWTLTARGFSSVSSDKLLVLSDTRGIYTPLFSGVAWDVQDYLLHDVDRIEVIRGPGATLWGSNAVNGVINITTKAAKDTQGLYVETTAGSEARVAVDVRYGGAVGRRGHYRVFGRYLDHDASFAALASTDNWRMGHVGFRTDWDRSDGDTVTVQGDVYRGEIGQLVPAITVIGRTGPQGRLRVQATGGNVLARWRHRTAPGSDIQVRAYYDRTHRNDPSFTDDLHTIDVDVQHRLAIAARHELTWGSNYRFTANRNTGKGIFNVVPAFSRDQLINGFAQDRIRLAAPLHLTIGTKLEHNDFSGGEVQPSARIGWNIAPGQMAWTSVSRAVRVPTRFERDIAVDVTDPTANPVARLLGNRDFEAERLLAYEAGYRWRALSSLLVDLAAFHNRYRGLTSLEFGQPFVDANDGRTVIPVTNRNLTSGRGTGLEALVTFDPNRWWRLTASSSSMSLRLDPAGEDLNRGRFLDGATPRHQLGLRSALDLQNNLQVDAMVRHLTAIRRLPASPTGEGVPGYAEIDVRVAWRPGRRAELAVVGQNLLHRRHPEFGIPAARGEIERSVYARLSWGL